MADEVITNLYSVAVGTTSSNPFVFHFETRAPTPQDLNYPIQKLWINTATSSAYVLSAINVVNSVQSAVWLPIFSGLPPSVATTYQGNMGSATPALNVLNVLGGTGITVAGGGNTLTLSAVTTPPFVWQTIVGSQILVRENGYMCIAPGGALSLMLPPISSIGDTIIVTLDGATSFSISQPNAASQIRIGSLQTTMGAGTFLTTTAQGNSIELVCQTANARWNAVNFNGNFLVS